VFVEQIGCFDRECLLLGLEVGEWFFGDLSVSLSLNAHHGGADNLKNLIGPNLGRFLVQFSTWATSLPKFGLLLVERQ
jgi:hypothetical protein